MGFRDEREALIAERNHLRQENDEAREELDALRDVAERNAELEAEVVRRAVLPSIPGAAAHLCQPISRTAPYERRLEAMSTAEKIREDALALPADERAALVDALHQSLSHGVDLSLAWKGEIASRIEAVERGESRLVPGDEVAARVRAALAVR